MKITVYLSEAGTSESLSHISSFLLHDPFGTPILIGLEYAMPEGTAWTFASADDEDFHKILGTSGILHTLIPGSRLGTPNLLCTPILRKGIPRWFMDVERLVVQTDTGIPIFLAWKIEDGRFRGLSYREKEFKVGLGNDDRCNTSRHCYSIPIPAFQAE
jgi:hypothetical protein